MGTALAIIVFGFPVLAIVVIAVFVRWLFAGTAEPDTHGRDAPRSVSLVSRFMRWARKPVPKLFYRRDKKGRFRKIRRG